MSPLATGYEHPGKVADEVWRNYLTPVGGTIERARLFERMLAALDPAELAAVSGRLGRLDVPVLLIWGTAEEALGVEWAYRLRDLIPGAREVVEVDGARCPARASPRRRRCRRRCRRACSARPGCPGP